MRARGPISRMNESMTKARLPVALSSSVSKVMCGCVAREMAVKAHRYTTMQSAMSRSYFLFWGDQPTAW